MFALSFPFIFSDTARLRNTKLMNAVDSRAGTLRLMANQIRGFWPAWGGWAIDGWDSFVSALVLRAENISTRRVTMLLSFGIIPGCFLVRWLVNCFVRRRALAFF